MRLPDTTLADICQQAATDGPLAALVATWAALGVDLRDTTGPQVKPWGWAIPADQWHTICKAMSASASPLGRANSMLDWVNLGPSAYGEDVNP